MLSSKLESRKVSERQTACFVIEIIGDNIIPQWFKDDKEIISGRDDRFVMQQKGQCHSLTIKVLLIMSILMNHLSWPQNVTDI